MVPYHLLVKNDTSIYLPRLCTQTFDESVQASVKELIVNGLGRRKLLGRQSVLDHILDKEVDVNLVQNVSHAGLAGVCQQHQFQIGGSLVVMQLVLVCLETDEMVGSLFARPLCGHVSQRENSAEDELGVVFSVTFRHRVDGCGYRWNALDS